MCPRSSLLLAGLTHELLALGGATAFETSVQNILCKAGRARITEFTLLFNHLKGEDPDLEQMDLTLR